jgi:peptidyl-prolyl cis-trans isomerase D
MLQAIRERSGKFFTKVIFIAIAISFVLTGIAGLIQHYQQNKPLVKVGKDKISGEQYAQALKQKMLELQEHFKGPVPADQLKSLRVKDRVLEQLIVQSALNQEINRHKVTIPDSYLTNIIKSFPEFQTDRSFDKRKLITFLQERGQTEQKFKNMIHSQLVRDQLIGSLLFPKGLPSAYKKTLHMLLFQEHVFSSVKIPIQSIKLEEISENFTDKELKALYNQNQTKYSIPEMRTISFLILNSDVLLKTQSLTVPPSSVLDLYEQRKKSFFQKEKRFMRKLTFQTKAIAERALEICKKGKGFASVGLEMSGNYQDLGGIDIENVGGDIQRAVQTLALNEPSIVVHDTASAQPGYSIFQIYKIEAPRTKSFAEVEGELQKELRLEQLAELLPQLRNKIEDMLGAGKQLKEVAQALSLTIATHTFSAEGKNEKGEVVSLSDIPLSVEAKKVLFEEAFKIKKHQVSPVFELSPEESLLIEVNDIQASYVQDFLTVQLELRRDLEREKKQQKANAIAEKLSQAKTQAEFISLANAHDLTLTTNQRLSRIDFEQALSSKTEHPVFQLISPDLAFKVFQLLPNQTAIGPLNAGSLNPEIAVVMYEEIQNIPFDQKTYENLSKNFDSGFESELPEIIAKSFVSDYEVNKDMKLLEEIDNKV